MNDNAVSLIVMNNADFHEQEGSLLTPLSKAEIRSIHLFYQAFTDKNSDFLFEAVSPDWQDIPLGPGQGPGPEGLKALLPGFFKAFPDNWSMAARL